MSESFGRLPNDSKGSLPNGSFRFTAQNAGNRHAQTAGLLPCHHKLEGIFGRLFADGHHDRGDHLGVERIQVTEAEEAVSFVHYYGHIFPCLKKDLKVDQVDPETLETKGTITLKAGTSLRPISTNRKGWEEEAFEIFKVIDKDTSKEVYVKLDLSFAEDDSVAKINGESVMDLFVRVFMGA